MVRWIRLYVVVLLAAAGLAVSGCGHGRRAQAYGGTRTDTAIVPAHHHSIIAGAAAGAVAGHMMGHHAVAGAIVGAVVQHERNKHQR